MSSRKAKEEAPIVLPELDKAKKRVEPEIKEADETHAALKLYTVRSQQDLDEAHAMVLELKAKNDQLENMRVSITGPLNAALRAANNVFQPPIKKNTQSILLLQKAIAAGVRLLQQAQTQTLATVAKHTAGGNLNAARSAMLAMPEVQVPKGVNIRKELRFEVVDLSKVPREYLSVDENKVNVATQNGVTEIPGLRFFVVEDASVRRSK